MPRQLILNLPVRTALGREDFFVSPANAVAVAMIDEPARWPEGKLLLIGPKGAGKSHLAAVWASRNGAVTVQATDLRSNEIPALAARGKVLVEDADRIARHTGGETALFHLHNLTLATGGQLLLTAGDAPAHWGLALADLKSRMEATASVTISTPDDTLLSAVFLKLFADRQIKVTPSLIVYLISRMDRSFATAQALVAELDARALALARPVTRALAAEVLDSGAGGTP